MAPAIPTTHENGTDHTGYDDASTADHVGQERADHGSWEVPLSPWNVLLDKSVLVYLGPWATPDILTT